MLLLKCKQLNVSTIDDRKVGLAHNSWRQIFFSSDKKIFIQASLASSGAFKRISLSSAPLAQSSPSNLSVVRHLRLVWRQRSKRSPLRKTVRYSWELLKNLVSAPFSSPAWSFCWTYNCGLWIKLSNSSRFFVSIAVSEDTRTHSSAHPFTPRLMLHLLVTMNTDRPRTRGLVLWVPGNFSFGSLFKIWTKVSEISSDVCEEEEHLVSGGVLEVMYNKCSEFCSSCCTNHDHGRSGIVREYHAHVYETQTPHKVQQAVTQALSALFVGWGPFLEDSVEQISRRGLPGVWYLNTFWFLQADHVEASLQQTLRLPTTNEAFIEVQL